MEMPNDLFRLDVAKLKKKGTASKGNSRHMTRLDRLDPSRVIQKFSLLETLRLSRYNSMNKPTEVCSAIRPISFNTIGLKNRSSATHSERLEFTAGV
jgi:hypothetical protein